MASKLPSNIDRARLVHNLTRAYGLLGSGKIEIIEPRAAEEGEIGVYHDEGMVRYLLHGEVEGEEESSGSEGEREEERDGGGGRKMEKGERYGLMYDCPEFEGMGEYVRYVAGTSIEAATRLLTQELTHAIHWDGGRHHARRASAAGFCYVNDAVLAILKLRTQFDRVLYIDVDLHHGDGVEQAFIRSDRVCTVSFHRYDPGFYPGTGSVRDCGKGKGAGYAINVPLKRGLGGAMLGKCWDEVVEKIVEVWRPGAVVVCCGVDGMTRDRHKMWNLAPEDYADCVRKVLEWDIPTLFLGGGGYNHADAARCWTYLTSVIVGSGVELELSREIPEELEAVDYDAFGPDYELSVERGQQGDENTEESLGEVVGSLREYIEKMRA
ncbi:histone deacetylase 8 [Saitoella complicata NRRL Y-17804]|uniref:histone deacetylase 8 n=1 Tax=Saitoella complicata (strain BCRC 22490 / CBS 7301 / JCM 7358 / NBRC 10748 / NRRL Y-17804) TaxID=698492 RepID=UPI000867D55A|nr:histone deacetylase 8 [Saitoella complicata NRRL Y-17804]ODQ54262.1 histone deacetylase 8 [Saitoella complicata NRRL Y-17804]